MNANWTFHLIFFIIYFEIQIEKNDIKLLFTNQYLFYIFAFFSILDFTANTIFSAKKYNCRLYFSRLQLKK